GLQVSSVCADYFMDKPLVRAESCEREDRLTTLSWLLDRCRRASITRMVLPFVDVSRIESEQDWNDVADALVGTWESAERNDVEIHLETSLPPVRFRE